MRLSALVRNRLLHFVVLGGAIFLFAPRPASQRDIAFASASLNALEHAQKRRSDDVGNVKARAIEDEILYREALRLGLERSDTIVRQRLIQKVLFLAEDLAGVSAPTTEADLRAFYAETRDQWKSPERVRFVHVYGRPDRRDELAALLSGIDTKDGANHDQPPAIGDAFPLKRAATLSADELARDFGDEFRTALVDLEVGVWRGPVRSRHGWHLVKVLERRPPGQASFEEVEGQLPLTLLLSRKKRAIAEFLHASAQRYRITIDNEPIKDWRDTGRVAPARTEIE